MSVLDYLGFGDDPLGEISDGFFEDTVLKDYAHASKLMRTDGGALAPNFQFLFHVYFSLNVPGVSADTGLVGALVKSVQLPQYKIDTIEHIQYNRKRLVNNRIDYDPVSIVLHDDSSDVVRSMWYNYYKYYFADSRHEYEKGKSLGYNRRDVYDPDRPITDWGVTTASDQGRIKPAFFKDIKIYGMSRNKFVLYTLVNPMISSWRHGKYDYEQSGGTMEHTMEVKYEAVKYSKGEIGPDGSPILGLGEPSRYDTSGSPLGRGGGQVGSILGSPGDILGDLAEGDFLGALRKGKNLRDIIKHGDIGDLVQKEISGKVRDQLPSVINSVNKQVQAVYPKQPDPTQNTKGNVKNKVSTPSKPPGVDKVATPGSRYSYMELPIPGQEERNKYFSQQSKT